VYLVADSGSSKADWVLFDDTSSVHIQTEGINPGVHNLEFIQNQLAVLKSQITSTPLKLFYYGAGTNSQTAKQYLASELNKQFPGMEISINSDLLAAGKALSNQKNGIVCILGTGSNVGICDGHNIIHQMPSLGYILNDEGSGNHLGKEIIKAFFYNKMDSHFKDIFLIRFPEVNSEFIYTFYQNKNHPAYLAKMGGFVIEHKSYSLCQSIIENCIETFISVKLDFFKPLKNYPVHFCGSVAFFLKDELKILLKQSGYEMGECIQKPIFKLVEYHKLY
jgi:N-acetylglucosamine kinase-like BadF-type ATPase